MYFSNILKGTILCGYLTHIWFIIGVRTLYQVLKKRPWGPNYVRIYESTKSAKKLCKDYESTKTNMYIIPSKLFVALRSIP